ncbi:MAG: restriction endonuclease subunit S, partial [Nautiliaceae bacterium]
MKPVLRFKEFSGEWKQKRLGEVAICEDNKRIPLNETERKQKKGIYPYWGSTKIMDYVDDYIFDGEYVLLSEDGGYFYDYKEKPIAFYVNGKFWANNHIHVLKINKGNSAKFIYYTLAHKNILAYIIGGTRTKLNQKDMLKIKIFTPPTLAEQQKIADFLSAVDEKIEITAKKIKKLKEYKKGLLQKLLNVKNKEPELRFPEFSGEWVEKRLGEVCKLQNGYPFKSKDYVKNGRYMIITI